jgi:hypothetical protein
MSRTLSISTLLLALLLPAAFPPTRAETAAATSCEICHADPGWVGDEETAAVVEQVRASAHGEVGLSCHDCHGGNPDPALSEDMDAAMDPGFRESPFRPVPGRAELPSFCGGCHGDPQYMKRYRPDARVDQEREYWTSAHGLALRGGDTRVATCGDCHGVHELYRPDNPESSVHPARVAETCRDCHEDAELMAGSRLADGRPLPLDQYSRWRRSVHGEALLSGDLFAPTCNDCHGNHGAAPPEIDSIAFVCGQCHGRESSLFRASGKNDGFLEHEEFMTDGGEAGCAACHEEPEPQAALPAHTSLHECAACHGNHSVVRPSVAMLSPLPEAPCDFCHGEAGGEGGEAAEPEKSRERFLAQRERLVGEGRAQGLEEDLLFDWLVDRTLESEFHTLALEGEEGEESRALRPQFAHLFGKFRIGKVHYTFLDPASGKEVREAVVRCSDCHGPEPLLGESPAGQEASAFFVETQADLTRAAGAAQRLLLAAQRGGVEVGHASLELKQVVDREIELQVLVHSFDAGEGSPYREKADEGLELAAGVLATAREGLEELRYRRAGLAVSLVLVVLVLVGLYLKIRQVSRRDSPPGTG